jgi:thioredoxin-related protein
MEEAIFPLPAVAEQLRKHFIEARLHTDGEQRLDAKTDARNKGLQQEMTGSKANPYFVIYDPVTGKIVLRRAGMMFEEKFLKFLRDGGGL